jgi:eukaryotic-like serine/threonine-protein kinase
VAAVIIGGMGWFIAGPGARAAVPSVTGLEQRDAADLLSSRHLKVTFDEEFDSSVEEGRAVSTDPGEGTKLPWGSVVTVIISKGPDWVAVPEGLIGADVTEAITAIEAAGLASVDPPVEAYSDDAPVGTVISVTLPDGSDAVAAGRAVRGAALTLSVSQGPAPVTMPSLTGLTVDEAEKRLADDDIALTTTTDWSSDVPKGQIISQDPGPGATVHRGDTVSVVVSDGVEMIAVPDVYHSGLSTARTTLEDAGFQVEVVHADQYYGLGFVVKQTPAAGTTAPRGTVVTLTVV